MTAIILLFRESWADLEEAAASGPIPTESSLRSGSAAHKSEG